MPSLRATSRRFNETKLFASPAAKAAEVEGRISSHLTLVVRRQPLVRLTLVIEHPGEAAVRPVTPHGAIRGPVIDIGDVAGGVLTAVGAPDDLGLVRARHASAARRSLGHYARVIAARLLTS